MLSSTQLHGACRGSLLGLVLLSACACGAQHSIGILLPWSGNPLTATDSNGQQYTYYGGYGKRVHPAIMLAFAAIKQDTSLLQEVRELTWVWHDDGCDEEKAIYATLQLIQVYGVEAIVGPSCSMVTGSVAKAAFFYDTPVIGYSIPSFTRATSSDLPNLVRTVAPYSALGGCIVAFMNMYNWTQISIIYESGYSDGWAYAAEEIAATLENSNINTTTHFIVSTASAGWSAAYESRESALSAIKASGKRIILIVAGCNSGAWLRQELYDNSMFDGYALIGFCDLSGLSCQTAADTETPEAGHLNNSILITFQFPSGAAFDAFDQDTHDVYASFEQYRTPPNGTAVRTGANRGGSNPFGLSYTYTSSDIYPLTYWKDEVGYLSYLYDGILLYARALNYTLTHGLNSTYKTFLSAVPKVSPFTGAWRSVEFNTSGSHIDRVLETRLYHMSASSPHGPLSFQPIAAQNSSGFTMLVPKDSIIWPGSTRTVPRDFVSPIVACSASDLDSSINRVIASMLTISVSYAYKKDTYCDKDLYDFPSDQTLKANQFPVESVVGVAILMCASVGTILCAITAAFVAYFSDHTLLQSSHPYLNVAWLTLSAMAVTAPLVFLGQPSSGLCQIRSWALFLPGLMLSIFMIARVHQLCCMISAPKKGVTQQKQLLIPKFFVLCTAPLLLLLVIGSVYEPPTSFSVYVQPNNAPVTVIPHFGCGNINESVFMSLLAYVSLIVLYGLWISSRLLGSLTLAASIWKSNKRLWEVRYLTYCTYITLAGQVVLLIASLYKDKAGLDLFRVVTSISVSLATCMSLCVIWVPRMAIILNEGIYAENMDTQKVGVPLNPSLRQDLESPKIVVRLEASEWYPDPFDLPPRATDEPIAVRRWNRASSGGNETVKIELSSNGTQEGAPASSRSSVLRSVSL